MQDYIVIDRDNILPPAQDFNLLREEAIERLAKLGSRRWTDFNTSDPGITLLEAMCYSITEMGYRTGFEIQDLIVPKNKTDVNWKCIFYTAKELLHNSAVTINDYRKLLLDIQGVRNVWIEPSYSYEVPVYVDQDWVGAVDPKPTPSSGDPCNESCGCGPKKGRLTTLGHAPIAVLRPLELEGLYNVLIQYEDDVNESPREEEVRKEVLERLHCNRNLCEDFINVIPVRPQKFNIDCNLIITPEADPDQVLARVFVAIYRYFSPTVRFYTIPEMLQKPNPHETGKTNYRVEDIFEGPALESGFIDDAELERTDMFRDIRLSDLINEIADIPGIRAITRFILPRGTFDNSFFTNWITELREKRMVGQLDIDKSRAILYKDSEVYSYDVDTPAVNRLRVKKLYYDLLARERNYHLEGYQDDFPIPAGEYSDLDVFVPIQNDLPHIYGVNPLHGIPGSPDPVLRDIQVKQLRGYLMLFDQLLADHLAQLASLNKIFSFCDEAHTQFFHTLHEELTYNLDDLFIADEDLLRWKKESTILESLQEEKEGARSFLIDDIAELKPRTEELAQFLKHKQNDKLLKHKYHLAVSTLAAEEAELKSLNSELVQIAQDIQELTAKIEQTESERHHINEKFGTFLSKLLDAPQMFVRRRNRMLNHLLARFGEDMTRYDSLMRFMTGDMPIELESRLIADKMRLLRDYPRVSNGRSRGFDYWIPESEDKEKTQKGARKKAWGGENISGTERRVSRILGFAEATREYLTPSWIEVEIPEYKNGLKKTATINVYADDAEHTDLFESVEVNGSECCIDDFIQLLIERGSDPSNYSSDCEERNNKTYHLFTLNDGENMLGTTRLFNTEKDANGCRDRMVQQFNNLYDTEGMHLIEHILLRPKIDEVLQYADTNPDDQETPPAEPIKLLCIDLKDCDHCGDCCFEVLPVEVTADSFTFQNPFNNNGTLSIEIHRGDLTLLDVAEVFKSAIRHRRNYKLSSDKKTVTISDTYGNQIATITLSGFQVGKPRPDADEIIHKIQKILVNNQLLLSCASPFGPDARLEIKGISPNSMAPAYRLDELLRVLHDLDDTNVSADGQLITITGLAKIELPASIKIDAALSNDEKKDSRKKIAAQVREAFHRCLSDRSFHIRITRLPAEKCYKQEPWVLEISALKEMADPTSGRIIFYKKVELLGGTWYQREMKFWQYEHLTAYQGRIRAIANESENYTVVTSDGKFGVVLKDDKGVLLAQTDYAFNTATEAEKWIEDIRRGFALEQDRHCHCNNCNNNEDPYSYRATVVLPCWSRRFQNKSFRHYAEQTLQSEKPAHVDLRVVWLGMEAMRRFEQIYRAWLIGMLENQGMPELNVVNRLVQELCHLKSCTECKEDCSPHHHDHD